MGRSPVLFTDTDSLMYHDERPYFVNEMVVMKDRFGMCNFEPTMRYYQTGFPANKMVVGTMKPEVAVYPIAELVELRPKMCSFEAVRTNPQGQQSDSTSIARR